MNFVFNQMKNPVNETVEIKPENLEPISFILSPIRTSTAFAVEAYRNAQDPTMSLRMMFEIGVTRVAGWSGVNDEEGNEVKFTNQNFAIFNTMPDAIPYLLEIGSRTIDEVDAMNEKKTKKAPAKKTPKQEAANNSSAT